MEIRVILHKPPVNPTFYHTEVLGKKTRLTGINLGTTGKTWLTSPYGGKTRLSRRVGFGLLALGGFQGLRGASIRGIFPRNIEGRSALKSFPESNSACLSFLGRSALKSFRYLYVFLYVCDVWAESFKESLSSCL